MTGILFSTSDQPANSRTIQSDLEKFHRLETMDRLDMLEQTVTELETTVKPATGPYSPFPVPHSAIRRRFHHLQHRYAVQKVDRSPVSASRQ